MRPSTLALILLGVFVGVVAVQHALVTELAPDRHMVSEYANAPFGWLMVSGFLAWAGALAVTAVALRHEHAVVSALLAVAGVGALILTAFPTQTVAGALPAGVAWTARGRLHDAGSGVLTLALFAAVLVSGLERGASARWRAWCLGLAVLAIGTNLVLLAVGPEVGGLRQRALITVGCAWQASLLVRARTQRPVR